MDKIVSVSFKEIWRCLTDIIFSSVSCMMVGDASIYHLQRKKYI